MNESSETQDSKRIANCILRLPESARCLEFHIGYNPATGLPMTGDTIVHRETGRRFAVVGREWQAGFDRQANVALELKELS